MRVRACHFLVVALVAGLATALSAGERKAPSALDSLREAFADAVTRVDAATVVVEPAGVLGKGNPCSGVLIAQSGVILSSDNAGALWSPSDESSDPSSSVVVRVPREGGRGFEVHRGEVVSRDEATGTSIIVCDPRIGKCFGRLRFGDSSKAVVGMFALTAGLTFGEDEDALPSVNAGVISCLEPLRASGGSAVGETVRFFTDAAGTDGMRGGPVTDVNGRLIGILSGPRNEHERLLHAGLAAVAPLEVILAHYRSIDWRGEHAGKIRHALKSPLEHDAGKSAAHAIQAMIYDAAKRAHPSVVALHATQASRVTDFEQVKEEMVEVSRFRGASSGVVVSCDGLVLTSLYNLCTPALVRGAKANRELREHLLQQLDGYSDLTVHAPSGVYWEGDVLACDPELGVVLIRARIEGDKDKLWWPAPIPACPNAELVPGRFVVTVGNPYLVAHPSPIVTWGVLSRRFDDHSPEPWARQWLTDAGVIDANCGGAAVDLEGRLMGMLTIWSAAQHGRNSGVGFIVPWEELDRFVRRHRQEQEKEAGPD